MATKEQSKSNKFWYLWAILLIAVVPLATIEARGRRGGGSYKSYSSDRVSGRSRSYRGAKAIDGDTFRYRGQRYRLRSYNAPEVGQRGSSKATKELQRSLNSGKKYKGVARDKYSRILVE